MKEWQFHLTSKKNKKVGYFFWIFFASWVTVRLEIVTSDFFAEKKIFFVDWKKTCRAENFNLKWHRWLENKTVKWSSCYRSYVVPYSYEDVRAATVNSSITNTGKCIQLWTVKKMFHWPTWRLFIWINQAKVLIRLVDIYWWWRWSTVIQEKWFPGLCCRCSRWCPRFESLPASTSTSEVTWSTADRRGPCLGSRWQLTRKATLDGRNLNLLSWISPSPILRAF